MPTVNKLTAEAFGTFCLIFAGCGAMAVNEVTDGAIGHAGVALSWGLIVTVMICAIGGVSGAHINPAVTVGFCLARQFPVKEVPGYIAAQMVGAFAAAGVLRLLFPSSDTLGVSLPHDMGLVGQSFGLELLLTLLLMFVILCVVVGAKGKGLLPAIAIGATVGLEAMFAGPICGASMNPARSIAPAIVSGHTEVLWLYIVGPLLGAGGAVPLYLAIYRTVGTGDSADMPD